MVCDDMSMILHVHPLHKIGSMSLTVIQLPSENPLERASKTAKANLFQTPIDEVDAAARILDPVFSASKEYGKFWKDYKESEW